MTLPGAAPRLACSARREARVSGRKATVTGLLGLESVVAMPSLVLRRERGRAKANVSTVEVAEGGENVWGRGYERL